MLSTEKLEADGGPVYPCHNDENVEYNWLWRGMTLRDHFAAQAIVGLASDDSELSWQDIAVQAYQLADAMLKARQVWRDYEAAE